MDNVCNIGYKIGSEFIGPMIFSYVNYVLDNCIEKDVKKVYFMARDGWLMYNCALKLQKQCSKYSALELEYLYVSRLSLRLPQYYVTDIATSIESIFSKESNNTLQRFFSRVKFTGEEICSVMEDINSSQTSLNKNLTENQMDTYKKLLASSKIFKKLLEEKSKKAYEEIRQYLNYVDMVSQDKLAIVDSGWVGSIQESLLLLLKSFGFSGQIVGYYFGMYQKRENTSESQYNTYYFSGDGDVLKKAYFNNNMFEILCSANHGMTIGYKKNDDNSVVPILADYKYCAGKDEVQKGAIDNIKIISTKDIYKNLKRLMHRPKKCYVDFLKDISFSDSLSDDDLISIAKKISFKQASTLLFPVAVFLKLTGQSNKKVKVFWEEGSITNSYFLFKRFFCFNVLVVKILAYMKKRK